MAHMPTMQEPGGTAVSTSRVLHGTAPVTIDGAASADLSADRTIAVAQFDATHAGVVPASGGGTTNVLHADGSWSGASSIGAEEFGDGSDGNATLDGIATVLGMVPGGGIYTATRDLFFGNLAINSGVTLVTAGYRLFVSGTLSGGGTIANNGHDGTQSTAGGGGAGAAGGYFDGGRAGGPAGNPGGSSANVNQCPRGFTFGSALGGTAAPLPGTGAGGNGANGGPGQGGGGGGAGGNIDSTGTGAPGGNSGFINFAAVGAPDIHELQTLRSGIYFAGVLVPWHTGTGGGGGSVGLSDGATTPAGGGGGSGGYVYVAARVASFSGSIQAKGGNGCNGAGGTGANSAGGAGGAGGSGGILGLVYAIGSTPTLDVSGGTGGAGGLPTGSAGKGGNGGNGGNGITVIYALGA